MKKHLLKTCASLFLIAIPFLGMSQIKVFPSGDISLGSLNQGTGDINIYGMTDIQGITVVHYGSSNPFIFQPYSSNEMALTPASHNYNFLGTYGAQFNSAYAQYVYGNRVLLTSDEKNKQNIKKLDNSLSKIMKMEGKAYDYKVEGLDTLKDEKKKEQQLKRMQNRIGFVAQELESVLPEAVVYEKENDQYYVDYVAIIPLLVEAMKEQQAQISSLQSELSELKNNNGSTEKSATIGTNSTIETLVTDLPKLAQNVPNPFSESTRIDIYLPTTVSQAMFYVYNLQGAQVKALAINQRGNTNVIIEGYTLDAGMYLYTLIADGKEVDTKRMILTK